MNDILLCEIFDIQIEEVFQYIKINQIKNVDSITIFKVLCELARKNIAYKTEVTFKELNYIINQMEMKGMNMKNNEEFKLIFIINKFSKLTDSGIRMELSKNILRYVSKIKNKYKANMI